ncbi:unnamed protein product [Rotaria socialis]
MSIHFNQSALVIVCLICLTIGIYSWQWWQKYNLTTNHFIHPTPKTDLDDLEKAILLDNKDITKCQHFAQGKQLLVADSNGIGYLCERHHLEKTTGCCQILSPSTRGPHICDSCSLISHCCTSFEDCTSCCLKADHRIHLQNYIRSRDLKTKLLLSHLSTPFDVCLSRCRTHNMMNINHTNNETNQIISNSNYLPFNIYWLDSSYQQTCLPDSPWQKILEQLEPILANRASQQLDNQQRRQILIELLGTQFQLKLFSSQPDMPHLLTPPFMSEEHRRKLENEAKSWLQIETFKAAVEIGATVTEDNDIDQLSNGMRDFLEYTYQIVCKSFECYLNEIKQREIMKQEQQKLQEINNVKNQNEIIGSSKFRPILRDLQANSKQLPMINELISTSKSIAFHYSDTLSSSIIAILKRDLRRVVILKEKVFGQQLPRALRQLIWTECLLRFEKEPIDDDLNFVEYQTRRDFAAGVTRGKNELQLKHPSYTPVANLIENAVIETYSKTLALHPYLEEHHLRLTIKILNVLYTYKKEYESYFIYWLLPCQLSYGDDENKNESIYVIAMHLNLFIRHCFPTWPNVFTIANDILLDLSKSDQNFYEHLKAISTIRRNINTQDFTKEIISLESKEASSALQYNDESMSNPVLFLRKWIGQMFVGILNSNAVLYLWDQFFMITWDTVYIKHAAKAILYLLRDRLMYATDYNDMRKMLLDEPCLLYTSDVQAAFIHLAVRNEDPKCIPAMNQRFYPSKSISTNQSDSKKHKTYLETIGIRNISLNLIIVPNLDPQEEFKYKSLIVEIQVHDDGEILGVVSTKSVPVTQNSSPTTQKLKIDIPNDKLIVSIQQVRHSSIPTRIQALVLVHQRLDGNTQKTLGFCRFPLYIPQRIGNLDTWEVTYGPIKRALHPGTPPSAIDTIPDVPNIFIVDTIGRGSTISLVVFDPKAEQYSQLKNPSR